MILAAARTEIDVLDRQLIDVLARRFAVVRHVAKLKKEHALAVVQTDRARAVVENAGAYAATCGLDPAFARAMVQACVDHAHAMEPVWMQEEKEKEKE